MQKLTTAVFTMITIGLILFVLITPDHSLAANKPEAIALEVTTTDADNQLFPAQAASSRPNIVPMLGLLLNGSRKTFTTVTSAGQIWMDRNLGASRVATSSTDSEAYGDLYQWGRGTDGHEKRTSSNTSSNSTSDNPGHGQFITESISPYDWRIPQNDNLWQGVSGTNNPCPSGFRLPTRTELDTERLSWSSDNSAGAYGSPLKLVVAGYRDPNSTIYVAGSIGGYWSSTVGGNYSCGLGFNSGNAVMDFFDRASGFSVRCLQD